AQEVTERTAGNSRHGEGDVVLKVLDRFRQIWAIDFEFYAPDGHVPEPLCVVGKELRSGRYVRQWLQANGKGQPPSCPFPTGPATLFVGYFVSAEAGCFLQLGWPLPHYVLDLYTEFVRETSGLPSYKVPHGKGLLGALTYRGFHAMEVAEKEAFRELAMRG